MLTPYPCLNVEVSGWAVALIRPVVPLWRPGFVVQAPSVFFNIETGVQGARARLAVRCSIMGKRCVPQPRRSQRSIIALAAMGYRKNLAPIPGTKNASGFRPGPR